MVSLADRDSAPLAPTETALALPMALPPAAARVPALMVIDPLWVLVPDRVTVPVPSLVRPPLPLTTPDKVRALAVFTVPLSVWMAMALVSVWLAAVVVSVPPFSVMVPLPMVPVVPSSTSPLRMVVPPE